MIQIDMPMPDNCDECRFNTEYGFCKAMPDDFCGNTDDRKRPEWCPLKEQEAVEPKYKKRVGGFVSGLCPTCGTALNNILNVKACGKCGQGVKWNDN